MIFRGVVGVGLMDERSGSTQMNAAGGGGSPAGDGHEEARLHADSDDGSQTQDPGYGFYF